MERVHWRKWPASWTRWDERGVMPSLYAFWGKYQLEWLPMEVLKISIAGRRWEMWVTDYRCPGSGELQWWFPKREELNMALVRMGEAFGDQPGTIGQPPKDAASYPGLWEHLSVDKWPDGKARETSTVIVVADNGGWRGCLSDKANGLVMWKTGTTLESLLKALEKALDKIDPRDWRRASTPGKKK